MRGPAGVESHRWTSQASRAALVRNQPGRRPRLLQAVSAGRRVELREAGARGSLQGGHCPTVKRRARSKEGSLAKKLGGGESPCILLISAGM